ncbi:MULTISPECIES: HEAT repeat domain-containing protein [Stenotrophomonas]|uniref:HEAT repeat domain-containing protein n=1 Tax=Stenotrophomonas TaxID=40323 RepID=UPI001310D37B|nr:MULTISPECIES: HEAT repeat domain-containing protein [Stenotrophomonas]ELC7321095.1 HEAT repeat domain-containing protein [Stenotrophomonas maltophilia]MBH1661163.1 HEAT repeat domain-containing protein [Stenotrophomonas maltophilia]MBH1734786.1 HEAT repeat domain-containing protein [Stenotrophomonas maltophilia]MBH1767590.1 HEAT repeat domain-containing protein [Stenotrophomonas maltophilia]MDZ5831947.1 HEAT repeat domain-containing protein [Stenotrophomonas maltophilia]
MEIIGKRSAAQLPQFSQLLEVMENDHIDSNESFDISLYIGDFERAVKSGEIVSIFNDELVKMCRSPGQGPEAVSGSVFAVAESSNFVISLAVLGRQVCRSEQIFTLPNDALVSNLGHSDFTGRLHTLPADFKWDCFDKGARFSACQEFTLGSSHVAAWESSKHAVEYTSPHEIVLLKLNRKRSQSIQWCFDRKTLKPLLAAACATLPSRLQVAARVMMEMEPAMCLQQKERCVEGLRRLLSHELHFVRWAMMQSLFSLSDVTPLSELQRMALDDPHPHVREAARHVLEAAE